MKLFKKQYFIFCIAALMTMSFTNIKRGNAAKGTLAISFINCVGNTPLILDSVVYKNELGQPFTVSNFKYYIGKICLKRAGGGEYVTNDYFLVSAQEDATRQIILDGIPQGKYTGISFIIGVDSAHNCSGAQSGDLDPVNAMFWAWNSGYIFLKLEGRSPASKAPGNIFELHIGGYKEPNNCIRTVTLDFKEPLIIKNENTAALQLKADIAEIMKTPTTIDLSKTFSVTDYHHATTIADNYADMFSLVPAK